MFICFSDKDVKGMNAICEKISIHITHTRIFILERSVMRYTRVSIVSKIYLFNHCQKHNLNVDRRVSSHLPLSNGQNRVEESSRTKALLYVHFDFPSLPLDLFRLSPFSAFSLSRAISTDWFRRLAWFPSRQM